MRMLKNVPRLCGCFLFLFFAACKKQQFESDLSKQNPEPLAVEVRRDAISSDVAKKMLSVSQFVPSGSRYVLTGYEISPLAKGFVPLVLLDLGVEKRKDIEVAWSIELAGDECRVENKFSTPHGSVFYEYYRGVTSGAFVDFGLHEIERVGGMSVYRFGKAEIDGQTTELMMYVFDDLQAIKKEVAISLVYPLWDWQIKSVDELIGHNGGR